MRPQFTGAIVVCFPSLLRRSLFLLQHTAQLIVGLVTGVHRRASRQRPSQVTTASNLPLVSCSYFPHLISFYTLSSLQLNLGIFVETTLLKFSEFIETMSSTLIYLHQLVILLLTSFNVVTIQEAICEIGSYVHKSTLMSY